VLVRPFALKLVLVLLTGCGGLQYEGWLSEPVPIQVTQDIPLVQVRYAGADVTATIDTGTPLLVLDQAQASQASKVELRLQDGAYPPVTRFVFHDLEAWDLKVDPVGLDTPIPVRGLLGATLLANFALHLSYVRPSLTLRDEIPDTNQELAADCDARELVSPTPGKQTRCLAAYSTVRSGEGMLAIGNDVVTLPATRLILPLCLAPLPFNAPLLRDPSADSPSGVDAMAVVATGLGMSVISRSAVDRLRARGVTVQESAARRLFLPYGSEEVTIVELERAAIVSDETIDLGPCGELARRRRLLVGSAMGVRETDRDMNGAAAAIVEGKVQLAVLDDDRPLLQGLRKELSPAAAVIDVVLGGSLLKRFEVEVDYPGQRVILQCAAQGGATVEGCQVLPWCGAVDTPRCPAPP
jgi:hypothetical protein